MQDKQKNDPDKYLKPTFYKDPGPIDLLLTFQPKTASITQYPPPKPVCQNQDIRKDRQILNKAYFQELTRKTNINSKLPSASNFSIFSNSVFPPKNQESSRLFLKSDSKPIRSKKKEIMDSMNASSYTGDRPDNQFIKDSFLNYKKLIENNEKQTTTSRKNSFKDFEETETVKNPTFNGYGNEKKDTLLEAHKKKPEIPIAMGRNNPFVHPVKIESNHSRDIMQNKGNNRGNITKMPRLPDLVYNKAVLNDLYKFGEKNKEPSSASKYSAIGSSISTDLPLLSPSNVQDTGFFKSYISQNQIGLLDDALSKRNSPINNKREHPKIKIRKSGFPKDVFTLKNK